MTIPDDFGKKTDFGFGKPKVVPLPPDMPANGHSVEEMKKALDNELEDKGPTGSLQWVKSFLVKEDEEDEEVKPLLKINNTPYASIGNHSLIIGKKKSRKTFFLLLLVKDYPGDIENEILWFDTEQDKKDCRKLMKKVRKMTGNKLHIFFLKGQTRKIRKDVIAKAIELWPSKLKLVIIDGVRDLVKNINSEDETSDFIEWTEKLITTNDIHIMNILHMNKNDLNARGHLGTELGNKAQFVIEISKDESTGLSEVKCGDSRDKIFEPFSFGHDTDDLPFIVSETKIKNIILSDDDIKTKLRNCFDTEIQLKYAELIAAIQLHFKPPDSTKLLGQNKAKSLLVEWVFTKNWIAKFGRDRAPDTVYKLMI